MTDITDIAALRSKAANVIGLLTAESLTGSFALDSLADVFDDMFRLLEAERQRADELKQLRDSWRESAYSNTHRAEKAEASVGVREGIIARKEFDALKVDQVPVGEIVAWAGTNRDMGITREIDFRFFRFDIKPGTKLYAIEPAPAIKSDLLTRAEALAVETRALAGRIQAGK